MSKQHDFIEYIGIEQSNLKETFLKKEISFFLSFDLEIEEITKISGEVEKVELIEMNPNIYFGIFKIHTSIEYVSNLNNYSLSLLENSKYFSLVLQLNNINFKVSISNIKGYLYDFNKILLYYDLGFSE